uniref:diamine acetyltransferase 1-like isoform X2 n=1 Tax=Podarcis muralis TaxID=64176 RepID=UPI00109F6444|nr:diamine acetyltransferase 1-like isoform X2 [Podarcis muralis]
MPGAEICPCARILLAVVGLGLPCPPLSQPGCPRDSPLRTERDSKLTWLRPWRFLSGAMSFAIRRCTPKDLKDIMRFIEEIAVLHNVPLGSVRTSVEELKNAGFGERPRYKCFVAEIPAEEKCKDGRGIGGALMKQMAEDAWSQGCTQLQMHVSASKEDDFGFLFRRGGEDLTSKEGWDLLRILSHDLRGMASRSKF